MMIRIAATVRVAVPKQMTLRQCKSGPLPVTQHLALKPYAFLSYNRTTSDTSVASQVGYPERDTLSKRLRLSSFLAEVY